MGITLVELLVTLAILGVLTSVVAIAIPPGRTRSDSTSAESVRSRLRMTAVRLRQPQRARFTDGSAAVLTFALPDGRIVLSDSLGELSR